MRILIVGHSVVDNINNNIKPGGIFYSVLGLSNFSGKDAEISLITSVSKDTYSLFESVYSKINQQYFQFVSSIPNVYLKLYDNCEREECYSNLTEKLKINHDINFNDFDGILINMITGFDLELEDLKLIRANYGGPIFFDVHTFSRGLDKNNKRFFRKIPDVKEWLSKIDLLQVNEYEIFTLSNNKNINYIIKEVFDYGIKYLIITKGAKGASIYYKENSIIKLKSVEAVEVNSKNSVGCGDIFGAVFFYSYIKSGNINSVLKTANAAAGVSTKYNSFNEYKNLREDADRFIN